MRGLTGLRSHDQAGISNDLLRDSDLLDILLEFLEEIIGQWLVHLFQLLELTLLDIVLGEFKIGLRDVDELLLLVFLEMLKAEFINGIVKQDNLTD